MAIIFCRECKKEVSSEAPPCPHCGVQAPGQDATPKPTAKETLLGLVVMCAIVAGLVYACSDSETDKKSAADAKATADAACIKDLQCIGDKGAITASIKCPKHIEKLSKNSMKWTDGTLDAKFSHFRWKDKAAGIVTHIGDKAQFQNGFGAFINVTYTCDLDMSQPSGEVVGVDVSEGRL